MKLSRPFTGALLVFGLLLLAFSRHAADAGGAKPRARLGINLSGPRDYNTELPFVDVFRMARPWISQRKGAAWGKGPPLALDEHGWVTRLQPGCWAETVLCTVPGGHYPAGMYTVLYDGEGKLEFSGAAALASIPRGQALLRVDPARGGFNLRITATNPKNYVRNVRVIMPGFAKKYRDNPWHPKFLERWQGMACLRFMDFMQTNNSTISSWSERPRPEDATFMARGVPLELMIDLANRLKADPWFCMPHRVGDEYVKNFATMVKERLDPGLKAYVEYSNEVWNGAFKQHAYAAEQGQKLGFAGKSWEAAWRYTAHRSVQMFRVWEGAFGGHNRFVRVLASQAANPYISQQIASFQGAAKHADVLAIAPYLTVNVAPKGKPASAEVTGWTVDQLLDHVERQALPQSVKWIRDSKAVAGKYGLQLVAYEGGQHFVGIGPSQNDDTITKLLVTANASARLGDIYGRYFDAWQKAGGDLFCNFNSVENWGRYGSWGLLQFYDDDPARSPKFVAVMRWARSRGQHVSLAK
jgi:hypothetical protein